MCDATESLTQVLTLVWSRLSGPRVAVEGYFPPGHRSDIRAELRRGEPGLAHVITLVWAVSIWRSLSEHTGAVRREHCYRYCEVIILVSVISEKGTLKCHHDEGKMHEV